MDFCRIFIEFIFSVLSKYTVILVVLNIFLKFVFDYLYQIYMDICIDLDNIIFELSVFLLNPHTASRIYSCVSHHLLIEFYNPVIYTNKL